MKTKKTSNFVVYKVSDGKLEPTTRNKKVVLSIEQVKASYQKFQNILKDAYHNCTY